MLFSNFKFLFLDFSYFFPRYAPCAVYIVIKTIQFGAKYIYEEIYADEVSRIRYESFMMTHLFIIYTLNAYDHHHDDAKHLYTYIFVDGTYDK